MHNILLPLLQEVKWDIVETLQSHMILTMSHWSSGLPVYFPPQGTQVQIPWGVLMWNRDSPVSVVSLQYYTIYRRMNLRNKELLHNS
jgi:hypothetical protein